MTKDTPQHYLANIEYENAHDALRGVQRQLREISYSPLDEHSDEMTDALDRLRNIIETEISDLNKGYEKTKNPLFLWSIYLACRWAQHPIPEAVLAYLDKCAENLLGHAEFLRADEVLVTGTRGNKDPGRDCLEALGLVEKGKLNAFVRMKKYWAERNVFKDILAEEASQLALGHKPTRAKENAIKTVHALLDKHLEGKFPSESQVRRIYNEHKKN